MKKSITLLTIFAICTLFSLKGFAIASITGPSSVCAGATITLADSTTGGTWTSSSTATATVSSSGVVSGVAAGTVTITYTTGGSTGASTTHAVTVNASPAAISGSVTTLCIGSTATFTDATSGGTWSLGTSSVATLSTTTGTSTTLGGTTTGTALLSYTLSSGCSATLYVSGAPTPTAGTISGGATVCIGGTTSLTSSGASSVGTWRSGTTSVATVGLSTGVVTGVTAGTSIITYTVINSCGSATATYTITVSAGSTPTAGTITGSSTVCPGVHDTLTDASGTTGGTWSSASTSIATITSGGIVTGVSSGTSTISYTVSSACATVTATFVVTVGTGASAGTISGPSSACTGSTVTLTDAASGGTWSSSTTPVATVDGSGVVYGVTAGSVTITYSVTGTCGTATATHSMSVNWGAGTLVGPTSVCVGANIAIRDTDGATGGRWYVSPSSVASISGSGTVYGIGAGTATVSYLAYGSGGCGGMATYSVTVIAPPATPRAISGTNIMCTGTTATFTDSTTGGTWSSRNTSVATVTSGGVVTAVAPGTDTILYSVSNACGTATVRFALGVSNAPATGTITTPGLGAAVVCPGGTLALTDTVTGGVWHSTNAAVATVNTSGLVYGVTPGYDTIYYVVTSSCGYAYAARVVETEPYPTAGTIVGSTTSLCVGSTTTLTDTALYGGWRSNNLSVATISSTGVVTAVSAGTVTITYTTTQCGSALASYSMTVVAPATAGSISGLSAICAGYTINFTDTTSTGGTGVWSSSNTSVASVNSSGVVTGRGVGSATITYSITNACGTAATTRSVVVTISGYAGTIYGASSTVCTGSTISFGDTSGTSAGSWSTSNTSIATISSTGVLTGVNTGTVNVSYNVSSSCGSASATTAVTVISASAGAITGATSVCQGSTISLSDGTSGGSWVSGNTSIATVNSSGVVSGVTAGSVTISYNVSNACGTATATKGLTVTTVPATPGAITGASSVCAGATTTFSDTTAGGSWSSSNNTIATVSSSGVVTGVAAGTDTIIYTVTNTCGSNFIRKVITVGGLPSAPPAIGGTLSVCTGNTTTLTDGTSGGAWSSNNTSIASISSSGVVTGVAGGSVTISYTVTNTCGSTSTTTTFTVNPAPTAGTISGASTVCALVTTTFTDGVSGGTWTCSPTSIATVSSGGVVGGVAAGTATIVYTVTGICGTATATRSITVNPAPAVAAITGGVSAICPGNADTLSDATSGGTWSSTNGSIATVGSTGIVLGLVSGTTVISYAYTNSCGTIASTKTITVNPGASAGAITGTTVLCIGSTVTLADSLSGGTWSSSNTSIATVSSAGLVSGAGVGTAAISYVVSGVCGTAITAAVITVGALPNAGTISGITSLCTGSTVTLSDAATGGIWISGNTAVATMSSTGVLTGVSGGTVAITYYVSSTCATAIATTNVTVSPSGVAGTLSGLGAVCIGSSITLTTSGASGGTWSGSNPSLATVNPTTGAITGVAVGSLTITYEISNACGTTMATKAMTVNPLPSVAAIAGPSSMCVGATTITLTDGTTGSATGWLSSNTSIASVTSAGVVHGIAAGTATITYYLTTGCGTARATHPVTVSVLSAGSLSGASTVVSGAVITLTASVAGGAWSSVTPTVATVTSGGIVTGVSVGADTIVYTVTNACGTISARKGIAVTAAREEYPIGGVATTGAGDDVQLYPNPSNGTFTLEVPVNNASTTVIIADLNGKIVDQRTTSDSKMSFDLTGYAAGIYIVNIGTGGNIYNRKIVIQ